MNKVAWWVTGFIGGYTVAGLGFYFLAPHTSPGAQLAVALPVALVSAGTTGRLRA